MLVKHDHEVCILSRGSPKQVVESAVKRQAMRGVRACTSEKSGRRTYRTLQTSGNLRGWVLNIVNSITRRAKLCFKHPGRAIEKQG